MAITASIRENCKYAIVAIRFPYSFYIEQKSFSDSLVFSACKRIKKYCLKKSISMYTFPFVYEGFLVNGEKDSEENEWVAFSSDDDCIEGNMIGVRIVFEWE